MKDRSKDPSHHEQTLLPLSYISLLRRKVEMGKVILEGKLIYFASPDPGVRSGAMGCLKKVHVL